MVFELPVSVVYGKIGLVLVSNLQYNIKELKERTYDGPFHDDMSPHLTALRPQASNMKIKLRHTIAFRRAVYYG
jgi:hypothetical protein